MSILQLLSFAPVLGLSFWSISDIHLDLVYQKDYDATYLCHNQPIVGFSNVVPLAT